MYHISPLLVGEPRESLDVVRQGVGQQVDPHLIMQVGNLSVFLFLLVFLFFSCHELLVNQSDIVMQLTPAPLVFCPQDHACITR